MRISAIAACIAIAAIARADDASAPALRVHTQSLANGLDLVLAPDPSVSSVVVHVRYGAGAGAETDAQAGYTLLVEKLLGLGTVHTKPGEFERYIDEAGGWTTSETTTDHLALVTQVPAGALERVLWLEAERMAGLADGITEQGIAAARAAVDAAYRAAYVDQPYALVARAVREALWEPGHPNRRDVLGDGIAVSRATLGDTRAFVRERIQPGNATLVITGNFDATQARKLVRRYFAWIPGERHGPGLSLRHRHEQPRRPRRVTELVDAVPRVVVAYRLGYPPPFYAELVAHMLAGSRASMLHRALVATGLASDVRVDVIHHDELQIHVTPAPGIDPRSIASVVTATAESAYSRTDLERARTTLDIQQLALLENLAGRSSLLARVRSERTFATAREQIAAVEPAPDLLATRWIASHTVIARAAP